MEEKGHCKHGEFELGKGCPQCIEEALVERTRLQSPSAGDVLTEEMLETAASMPAPERMTAADIEAVAGDSFIPLEEAGSIELPKELKEPPAAEMALAKAPGADVEVMSYYQEALKLQGYAEKRVINSVETSKTATDDLSFIAKLKKAMEDKRKEYLAPFKAKVEAINETYKLLMAPIFAADETTRKKMVAYDAQQRRIQAEQEEINRKRMEAAQQEAALSGTGEISEPVNLVEVAPAVKNVRTNLGTAGMVDCWKYEVTDLLAIPREYLVVDGAMLNAIAKKHHDTKPVTGIRFYNEPTLAVRAR